MTTPYLLNISPIKFYSSIDAYQDISFSIKDDGSDLKSNTIMVYVDKDLAFDGSTETFNSPYNGALSSFSAISDGYSIVIDNTSPFSNVIPVSVHANDGSNALDAYWGYIVESKVHTAYFSDGYGLKKIGSNQLAGESQSVVKTVFSSTTLPHIPENNIISLHGNNIDGYSIVALALDGYNGLFVSKDESDIEHYRDGYRMDKPQLIDKGILYVINKDNNTVEAFYGANTRTGSREPDFVYSSSSTPSITSGEILSLYAAKNSSSKYSLGTRLYVGTAQGATRIETYDKQTNGYCDGYDSQGISYKYGIAGSGLQYEVLGGSVSRVVAISSNEDNDIMFVATADSGLSQVNLTSNQLIYFMTQSNLLPSNSVRDILGKIN